ncbi:polysaccharide deacetylase family protein [Carboxylicivirga sp. N1Y90]|uniref:polysaccharide deacetylase family protein n=1 Tax=Carboxylicivirga fragile TaxID=3417571 RepID=UPI003D32D21E|nr:polysaccharide deacetylase family protein [Marinilabiliaceae bacterium N1Y90]
MENNQKGKAIILLYHQVGRKPIKQTNLDCYCHQDRFKEQMAFLNDSKYKVISLDDLVGRISSLKKDFDDDYVVLTFDDGCEKFSETVLPILRKYDFPSTIYPVAGCLGEVASWSKVVNPDLSIVSKLALKQLSEQGVSIGAHTISHINLSNCDIDNAKEEIFNSKVLLESIIKKDVTSFSYPHGGYNEDVRSLVKSLGFSNAVTCNSKFIKPDSYLFELPRKYVTYFDTLESFKTILTDE